MMKERNDERMKERQAKKETKRKIEYERDKDRKEVLFACFFFSSFFFLCRFSSHEEQAQSTLENYVII